MKKELQEDFIYSVLHWFQSLYMTVNIQILNLKVETLQFCISCLFLLKTVLTFSVLLQNLQHHSSPFLYFLKTLSDVICLVWLGRLFIGFTFTQEEETHMNYLRMIYEVNLSDLVFRLICCTFTFC